MKMLMTNMNKGLRKVMSLRMLLIRIVKINSCLDHVKKFLENETFKPRLMREILIHSSVNATFM